MLKSKIGKSKSNLLKLCVAFLFPFTLFGGIASSNLSHADSDTYVNSYQEVVDITNGDFTSGSSLSSSNSLSGWSAIEESSNATGMFVDVGSGTNTGEDESNSTFSENQDRYMLQSNPGAFGDDNRILMINSKQNNENVNILASKGYRSETITLEANSYYIFSVAVKTMANGDTLPVNASIYLNGLKDVNESVLEVGVENITSNVWKEYFIYIATGDTSQDVSIELYLGGKDDTKSSGVVFFDNVNVNRYSENIFYSNCYQNGYNGFDTLDNLNNEKCFVVDSLKDTSSLIDTSDYNFDFEDEITSANTLGDKWSIVSRSNGHAIIADIKNMQPSDFKNDYGYDFIGNDLTYQNQNAMILTTKGNEGYVGVESSNFEIKAHSIYKVSFNIKVTSISNGSFYFKVQENDTIYNIYSDIITNDESDSTKNYLSLQDGQTSGISSNLDNSFMNDYQTVEIYIKGHSLYDTSVNFQLWLGDSETSANGCVVVDNITVEYANNEDFAGASNSVEFSSFSSTPSTIPNSYFNATEFDGTNKYPLKASDWTSEIENEKYNDSGVIYLYDVDSYNKSYLEKYEWAGIYPGHPTNTTDYDLPNNVYMMYNNINSFQKLTSGSYTLASNSYYKLSFNYYNENRVPNLNQSKIKLEIVDENGITLFVKDNISSLGSWNEINIYFHTAELVSNNIQVIIHFGQENDKVAGIVYLDNFVISESNETEFNSISAINKADLTDYYLNLTENGTVSSEITSTSAYDFSVEPIYGLADEDEFDFAVGGIVSGNDNPYGNQYIINDSNYLAISTKLASSATLTSKYTVSMEQDKYYKFTFDLATIFGKDAENASTDNHDCQYGVTITVDGFEPVSKIVTNDELKNFTIYMKCTEAVTPTIAFTLVSDCHETLGTALITHLDFTPVEENEYNNALLSNYFGETVFKTNQENIENDDNTDDDTDSDTGNENTSNPEQTSPWLLISSLIFGVAIIVAIIGFVLRHVKIKKIEKIRKENYDRKLSKNHDVILVEAQKRRDNEVKDLQSAKKMLEEDKVKLEEAHKTFMKESRLNNKGQISKEVEKAIKRYNNDIIRLDEKINIISEKIDTVMSAEYLLMLERRIVAEEDTLYKNEKKAYKSQIKEMKNLQKIKDVNKSSNSQTADNNNNGNDIDIE